MRRVALALPVAALIATASPALADDACVKAPDAGQAEAVFAQISLKRGLGCYDVMAHPAAPFDGAPKALEKAEGEASAPARRRAIEALLDFVRTWSQTGIADAQLRRALQTAIAQAVAGLSASPGTAVSAPTAWKIEETVKNKVPELRSKALGDFDLSGPLRARCVTSAPAADCAGAIAEVEGLLRSHSLVEGSMTLAAIEAYADYADLFDKRAKMWDAYRTEARPQYLWEWLFNGAVYKDERPRDTAGNPLGPAYLPSGQVILFHPGVGLERFDRRGSGQTANNPTLYLEWIGFNRLHWDYEAGKLDGGLGVSLVSVYAPRQDGVGKWTRGVMFWSSNKYGLAVTRNGDGTSIMLSLELADLFRDKLNQLNDAVDKARSSK